MTPKSLATEMLPVSVVIPTKNEAANLERSVGGSVAHATRVFVVDSQSTDGTPDLARRLGAEVWQFDYGGGYPKKRQWALEQIPFETPWVLLLDADEEVPAALWEEIAVAVRDERVAAYFARKEFHFLGRRLRFGGFSHSAILLLRHGRARFERPAFDDTSGLDMEVHERLLVSGPTRHLRAPLLHYDQKGLSAYVDRHNRYATWDAAARRALLERLTAGGEVVGRLFGNLQERRRFLKRLAIRMPFEPTLWFLYHYVVRLAFLEGRRGLIASQIRAGYIALSRAKLFEASLRK